MNKEAFTHPDYRMLFEQTPSLYMVLDPNLRIVAASDAYLKSTLTRREDIVGRHVFEVFPDNPHDFSADAAVPKARASFNRVLQTLKPDVQGLQRHDVRKPESEGAGFEVRYWNAFNSPILNPDGSLAYVLHRVENVTEFVLMKQKGIEQSRLTDKLRDQAVRMEAADHLEDQEKDFIVRMITAADRMRELLDALLTYSRVETKAQELKPTNLEEVLEGVKEDLEVLIRESRAQVEIGPLPTLLGDPLQLRQLFQNLISNAIKYRKKDVTSTVKIHGEKLNGHGRIVVEDNGIGFDEKYLEKIFQPFQRLHGRNEYPGVGIGLAICKKIVERHRGTITAKSTPGKGSTFIVTLPSKR